MSENDPKEPKIIIDEDWKTQVESEKEAAEVQRAQGGEEGEDGAAATETAPDAAPSEAPQAGEMPELPPASFPLLVSTLAAQAVTALGQVPDGPEDEPQVNPPLARHFIDTLSILEEKTAGNLEPEEKQMLSTVLQELRMLYVSVSNQA